tara:strand:+ start:673 stop:855 length:183 start_codon:yes stop_codon:yes gene_type:complete
MIFFFDILFFRSKQKGKISGHVNKFRFSPFIIFSHLKTEHLKVSNSAVTHVTWMSCPQAP